jgi:MinD-like ATPase involved in chromosome partitioning or flagellar assembly
VSERDWQAAVLSELGVKRSGLVTADSRVRPSVPAPSPPAATEQREPPRADPEPIPSRPIEPEPEPVQQSPEPPPIVGPPPTDLPGPPPAEEQRPVDVPAPPSEWAAPAAQVHSAPVPPERSDLGHPEPPQQQDPSVQWPQPAEQQPVQAEGFFEPPDDPEPVQPGWAESGWEQASQDSWDQVAQSPWGPAAPAPQRAETWEQSEAGAWQRDPGVPADPGPVAPRQPARPRTPEPPSRPQGPPPSSGGPMGPNDLVRKSVHGDPLVRRMGRNVRRVLGDTAVNEVRRTADVEAVLGRAVPSCRQIAVTSIRGGAGKTTVAGLTATVIAQYRQDRVLAVDADSGLGSLPLRLGVRNEHSLHDLTAPPRSFEDATRYLGRTADGLWVLSGTAGGRITHELELGTFRQAAGGMNRFFSATVIDCGAGLLPELQRGILTDAHAQVMVTPGTVDGAVSAQGALEWQATHGYEHLLTRTVIAFVTHTPHVDADLTRAAQMLSGGGLPVVHLPYDRHLATGTAIESARIGQETRAAAIRVAVEAFARAMSV